MPLFALLRWRPASFASRVAFPAATGLALGLGLLYKSFALVVPVGLALVVWYAHAREWRLGEVVEKDLAKVVVTLAISLAIFSTWFLLDPDPRAVRDEFVGGENLGKFDLAGSYLRGLLWGPFSLPSLAAGLLLNAGLLMLPFGALLVSSWRRRGELREGERLLWIWVVTLFIVYCFRSQRSSRYLLPAMPAVAVLLALYWPRMRRGILAATVVVSALPLVATVWLSLGLQDALPGPPPHGPGHWSLLAFSGIVLLLAVLLPTLTRPGVLVGVLLVILSFSPLLQPLDGPWGRYDAKAQRAVAGRDVWVPVDFIAKEESYRLLLPGTLGVPAYQSLVRGFSEVLRVDRSGAVIDKQRVSTLGRGSQPVVLPTGARDALALMRPSGEPPLRVVISRTRDAGGRWTDPVRTSLVNPDAGLGGLVLPGGRVLVALNDIPLKRDALARPRRPRPAAGDGPPAVHEEPGLYQARPLQPGLAGRVPGERAACHDRLISSAWPAAPSSSPRWCRSGRCRSPACSAASSAT